MKASIYFSPLIAIGCAFFEWFPNQFCSAVFYLTDRKSVALLVISAETCLPTMGCGASKQVCCGTYEVKPVKPFASGMNPFLCFHWYFGEILYSGLITSFFVLTKSHKRRLPNFTFLSIGNECVLFSLDIRRVLVDRRLRI